MDTTEGNKLIAEFMGLKIITDGISWFDINYKPLGNYHSSWDWLMPVVEKIWEYTGTRESIFYFGEGDSQVLVMSDGQSNIADCWNAVIAFINWYNYER